MRDIFIVGIAALSFVGCAASQKTREPPARPAADQEAGRAPMMGQQEMRAMCPMMVEGSSVRAEAVEDGAALVFTTSGDVADLRRRVARMAEMHNRHHARHARRGMKMQERGADSRGQRAHEHGSAQDRGAPGGTMAGRGMMMPMMRAHARAEEVEGGARIVFTSRDPARVAALRGQVRDGAERMSSGQCPMMGDSATSDTVSEDEHEAH